MNNKTSWFDGVFLKSLFDQSGTNKAKWITAKQVNICRDYMRQEYAHIQNASGENCKHFYYTCNWQGRKVTLNYSSLNGCGTIIFGLTDAENAQEIADFKSEKEKAENARLKRLAIKRPDELKKRIADATLKLENAVLWLEDDIADGATEKEIKEDKKNINNLQNDLNKLLAVQNLEV